MGSTDTQPTLQDARGAFDRRDWAAAFDLFSANDATGGLPAEDLERLAQAAANTGRLDACIAANERAYAGHLERGNPRKAAVAALALATSNSEKLARSVAAGWLGQAVRLLESEPESIEHGYLAHTLCRVALGAGDFEAALEHAVRAFEIGQRLRDPDLLALGLDDRGLVLVAQGRTDEGLALLDQAIAAAVAGTSDNTTSVIYCNLIDACRSIADYRRAGEWTDAAQRWRHGQGIAGFPALCRLYRSEILEVRGAWEEAEQDARIACDEMEHQFPQHGGVAYYRLGEILLCRGDLARAEDAFRRAHQLGREPQPGLALLRLAEGKADTALAMIKRAPSADWRIRKWSLVARVEIALAASDLETAGAAAAELEADAEHYGTPAARARATCARGAILLAEGRTEAALERLRSAVSLSQEADAPYETAKTRVLLAQAYLVSADEEAMTLELQAALATFDQLGAAIDTARTAQLLGNAPRAADGRRHRAVKTFMFTDICSSTNLIEAIGDDAWEDVLRWHDEALRAAVTEHHGEEVKHEGDGFFVAFDDSKAALDCAVAIQRKLAEHRRAHGFAPPVRIGLHAAEATRRGRDYGGKGVHLAARIAALGEAGEIVASRDVASGASVPLLEPREVRVKGISAPVQVVSIAWR